MPNQKEPSGRDYSRFDALSTEALMEILYQDSLLPEGEESDLDAILYITEVIAKREELNPTMEIPPVDKAWKSFNEHYRCDDCDGTSLYEDPEESASGSHVIPFPAVEHTRPKRRLRGVLRVCFIAAALLAILILGSLTAYAMGYNVWDAMAQWTEDTFSFMAPQEDVVYTEDDDPREVLREYGITESILPNRIPDGYQYAGIEISDTPARKVFYISFVNGAEKIKITISMLSTTSAYTFEKNKEDAVMYEANGIEHYIMSNIENTSVSWTVGNCECSIIGNISMEDAQNMINSIYGS